MRRQRGGLAAGLTGTSIMTMPTGELISALAEWVRRGGSVSGHVLSKDELVAATSALDRLPGTGNEPSRPLSRTPRT